MKNIIRTLSYLILIGLVTSCQQHEATQKPNILLIVADDLGYADLSFLDQSPPDVSTPHIDRIASEGTYFSNAYATSPICSPSRTGLITGRYQARWGNYWYGEGGLPASELTIPQMLQQSGYRTYKVGKTHLNGGPVEHPLDHGFDEFLGFMDHTWDYLRLSQNNVDEYGEENARLAHLGPLTKNREKVSYENDYTTDIFSRKTAEIIREDSEQPFFIQLAYNAIHHPTYICHPDYLDQFGIDQFPFWNPEEEPYMVWHRKWGHLGEIDPDGRKRYLLQLTVMDDGIGQILNALQETGKYENTIIILISDNGGTINTYSNNQPLNGWKYMFGEGGVRIPMVVSWPGKWPKNEKREALVSAMDICPTLANVAGYELPENLDGKNLVPVLNDQVGQSHQTLFFADGRDSWVVRHGPWKLAHNIAWTHKSFKLEDGKAQRADPYVYPGGLRLYNLEEDIGEEKNLAGNHPEIVDSLQQLYRDWRAEMDNPRQSNGHEKEILPPGASLPPVENNDVPDIWSDGSHNNHYPGLAIDGNPETWWTTQAGNLAMPFPHFLVIDLKEPGMISGFRYLPAQEENAVKKYQLFVSEDAESWGDPVKTGEFTPQKQKQLVEFDQPRYGRYLKFQIEEAFGSEKIANVAELEVIKQSSL